MRTPHTPAKGGRPLHSHFWRALEKPASPILHFASMLGARLAWPLLCISLLLLSSCTQASGQGSSVQQHGQKTSALTYVAIGASDTFGIGSNSPYTQNWAADLTTLIGGNIHLINLGVPGITAHGALSAELPIAIDAHPNLVTVWLAVNDLADNVPIASYSQDLGTLLSRLQKAAPQARIEVGNVPDLTRVPYFHASNQIMLSQQITAYNTAIATVVQSHHAILVDLSAQGYDLQTFPQYVSQDGLHPSSTGYLQLAQLFYNALQKAAH